jgi:hypothetical protein
VARHESARKIRIIPEIGELLFRRSAGKIIGVQANVENA